MNVMINPLIGYVGAAIIIGGVLLVGISSWSRNHVHRLEWIGAILVIFGLAVIGTQLTSLF